MQLTFLVFLLLISGNLFSQEINKEKIDNYLSYIQDNNGGMGSLSIFKDGKEVYNRNFGQGKVNQWSFNDKEYFRHDGETDGFLSYDIGIIS